MVERVLGVLLLVAACKPATTVEKPSVAEAVPVDATGTVDAAKETVEPDHAWPVAVADVRGHAPLPDGPRQDVWLTMDGIGATVGGENHKVSVSRDGIPGRVYSEYLLPELYETLAENERKGTVTIWADETLPVATLVQALYTSGKAGFRDYLLVVGKPGAREVIAIQPTQYVSQTVELEGPAWGDLGLRWASQGVHADVRARYDDFPNSSEYAVPIDLGGGSCVFPGGARPDPEPLQDTLDAMCLMAGKPFALRVSLDEIPTMGDLLWTLAADTRPAECRMPAVVDAGGYRDAPSCDGAGRLAEVIAAFPKTTQRMSAVDAAAAIVALENESGRFIDSPYADDVGDDDEDVWGGLTGTEVGEAFGVGGLGLVDEGSTEEGAGNRVPRVRQAKASVKGPLDKDIIRRIVRAHINEVRHCYNKGLQKNPELSGRVTVEFVIARTGKVSVAAVASTTLEDKALANCTAKAVKRWKFPKPEGGGEVVVNYPFVLSPG